MAAFVSQFGAALLEVQEELRRSVDQSGAIPQVANVIVLSLDRETFRREQGGISSENVEQFRKDLRREVESFLASNEWGTASPLSFNILLRSIDVPCRVRVERRDSLYALRVKDDGGERLVPVRWPSVMIGREHSAPPRAFVPVRDASRSLSREHLLLTFRDLELTALQRGQNPTTLNGEPIEPTVEISLSSGDLLRCGPHTIEVVIDDVAESAPERGGLSV